MPKPESRAIQRGNLQNSEAEQQEQKGKLQLQEYWRQHHRFPTELQVILVHGLNHAILSVTPLKETPVSLTPSTSCAEKTTSSHLIEEEKAELKPHFQPLQKCSL